MTNQQRPRHTSLFWPTLGGLTLAAALITLFIGTTVPVPPNTPHREPHTQQAAAPSEFIPLLAPQRAIGVGEPMASVEFRKIEWPAELVPEGALRSSDELQGKYAKVALSPEHPVRLSQLSDNPVPKTKRKSTKRVAVETPSRAASAPPTCQKGFVKAGEKRYIMDCKGKFHLDTSAAQPLQSESPSESVAR